jgi:glycosyltransferase involved in cell wall biosynthesis
MQLRYLCYLNQTGYGVAAQDYIRSILHADPGVDLRLSFVNPHILGVSANRRQLFQSLQKKEARKPFVTVYHTIPMLYRREEDCQKSIGVALFETINVPAMWVQFMNRMDQILTASEFNRGVFQQAGVTKPVEVVPHCFDPKMFNRDVTAPGRYDRFTFFSMGTWRTRKNWTMLIRAFYDGFENRDKVCLLIKTDKVDRLKAMVSSIKRSEYRSKDTAPIYAEEKSCCEFEDIPGIMKKGDVCVCPSLGEGFGLPGLHAMALGIPLIVTKFGGSLQYAKPEFCSYIEPTGYRSLPTMDGIPQFVNCIWPIVGVKEIRDAMRAAFEKPQTEKAAAAYNYVHSNYTYDVVGRKMIETVLA